MPRSKKRPAAVKKLRLEREALERIRHPRLRRKRYYDPGKNPQPRKPTS